MGGPASRRMGDRDSVTVADGLRKDDPLVTLALQWKPHFHRNHFREPGKTVQRGANPPMDEPMDRHKS